MWYGTSKTLSVVVKANKKPPTVSAPTERPGVRRTAEMTKLYGKGAAFNNPNSASKNRVFFILVFEKTK